MLNASALQQLWSSPLLRSSQAITGLFHEGVIICEGDADSRFYEGIVTGIESAFTRPLDLHYVHGAGKGALAHLARAYASVSVKTAVIADFDLLKNAAEFLPVYTALGGATADIERSFRHVSRTLSDQGPVLAHGSFVASFRSLIDEIDKAGSMAWEAKSRASDLLDNAADWSEAKKYGIDRLKGGARQDAKDFLEKCKRVGLFLVPVGELEGWWRDGPAGKTKWIGAALEKLNSDPTPFEGCQAFAREICTYFGYDPVSPHPTVQGK